MIKLSNTNQRIISAIVLFGIICLLIFVGGKPLEYFLVIVSLLLLDELLNKLMQVKRCSKTYAISQILFLSAAFIVTRFVPSEQINLLVVGLGIPFAFGSFFFLFFPGITIKIIPVLRNKMFLMCMTTLVVSIFWGGLFAILQYELWVSLLAVVFFTTYATDTFAWLIGTNLGRKPLWPAVSPKKTVEGAIGGYIGGAITGVVLWWLLIDSSFSYSLVAMIFLPLVAKLGDLTQSRIKRWVGVKDSSKLIPGHGGLFDRVDSFMLVVPFFVAIIWGYYA